MLHAHDFRDAREFAGKDLLILGTSYSAEDIGSQCWKYGAKSITVAHRNAPMGFDWPSNWKEVPKLERVDETTAYFEDGTVQEDRRDHPLHRLQAPLPVPAGRSAAEDGEPAGDGGSV